MQATQALQFVGKTAIVDGNVTAMSDAKATWELNVPSTSTITVNITNSTGQTVFTGNYSANAGDNQPFPGTARAMTARNIRTGIYTLTATAQDSTGNTVAISTQVGGIVTAVDLTQSPPMLSINGQSYTMSQIKAIGAAPSSLTFPARLQRAQALTRVKNIEFRLHNPAHWAPGTTCCHHIQGELY